MRALEALADELAHARAEARQHCAAAERARSAAQRLGQARTVALGTVALGTVAPGTVALGTVALGTVAPGVCMHTLLPRACTCCMKEGRKDLWTRTQRVDGAWTLQRGASRARAARSQSRVSRALTRLRTPSQLGQLGLELLEAADDGGPDGGAAAPRAGGVSSGGVSTPRPGSTPRTTAHPAAGGTTRSVMRGGSSPRGTARRTE